MWSKIFLTLLITVISSGNIPKAAAQFSPDVAYDAVKAQKLQDFMECYLILIQVTRDIPYKQKVETIYPKMIREYEEFIRRRPTSEFVDDAMLHIAEIYNWSAPRADQRIFPTTAFNEHWLEEANVWLWDIVKQHPRDLRFNLVQGKELTEPTAAIALYYLGNWNRDFSYLERLLHEYPDTEPAGWVRERLKQIGEEQQKKAEPSPVQP